jgi:hypothetical protein
MTAGPTGFNGSLAPFSIQPAQGFGVPQGQGMFGQRRQGPFGGAMGMNPIMRLMAVLMHGQGLSPMGMQPAMQQNQMQPQYNQAFPPLPYGG